MCHRMTVCAEQALLKWQGGRTYPVAQLRMRELGLCSTLPGKANDIMPVLREARGDMPDACMEQEALGIDNGRRTRGFPSTSCCSWPRYKRRQRDRVGSSANFHSYQYEETAVRRERGPFKCHIDLINYGPWRTQRNA